MCVKCSGHAQHPAQPAEVQKCWLFYVAVVSPQSRQRGPCREPGVERGKGSLMGDTAHGPGPTEAVLRRREGTPPCDTRGALLPPSPPPQLPAGDDGARLSRCLRGTDAVA